MSDIPTFATHPFDTAKQLFDFLSPDQLDWAGPNFRRVIWRGQGQDWPLVPTALRQNPSRETWLNNRGNWQNLRNPRNADQLWGEVGILREFFNECDRQGLRLPEDGQLLRDTIQQWTFSEDEDKAERQAIPIGWPQRELLSLLGLAQHSGIPTRLLDWSWNPYVSAYTAAKHHLEKTDISVSPTLVIWAFNTEVTEFQAMFSMDRGEWPIRLITAPTADNPNLRAQQGLFTLHYPRETMASSIPNRTTFIEMLGRVVTVLEENVDFKLVRSPVPYLHKLTLPVAEAIPLLKILFHHGYHHASMFPGFAGAAEVLKQRRILDL